MNFRSSGLAFIASSTIMLANCGGSGTANTYRNLTITVTPEITSLPVSGTQTFTATVTNGPSNPTILWSIYGSADPANVGSFSTGQEMTNGTTVTYTAPAAPPVYSENTPSGPANYHGSGSSTGSEGIATVEASVVVPGSWAFPSADVNFTITGPMSTGIAPASASLQLGKFLSFSGYCVGSTNNNLAWQVNGVTGGGAATGTIAANVDSSALYTAPTVMPMTGNTVTITAACQADQTKHASTTVTLTP